VQREIPVVRLSAAAVAAVVMAMGCDTSVKTSRTDSTTAVQVAQEPHGGPTCGLVGDSLSKAKQAGAYPVATGTWVTWAIPEYQDEQRFNDRPGAGRKYGALACIVAAPRIDTITDAALTNPAGVLLGVVYVDGSAPIATGDPYADLHLKAGYNCVIVRVVLPAVVEGHVVPVADSACTSISAASRLPGNRGRPTGVTANDIPAVARFVEKQSRRVGLGIRCGTNWCNLGFTGTGGGNMDVAAHPVPAPGAAHYVRRVVRGWYDQQFLALPNGSSPFGVISSVLASTVPDDNLESYTTPAAFATRRHVADVTFPNGGIAGTKYETRWHFKSKGNTVDLQLNPTTSNWTVYVNGVPYDNLTVKYTSHAGFPIAGTARWHWKPNDESLWVRCIDGCCEVDAT